MSSSPFGFPPPAPAPRPSRLSSPREGTVSFAYPSPRLYLFLRSLSPFSPLFSLLSCPVFSDLFLSAALTPLRPLSPLASKFRLLSASFESTPTSTSIVLKSPLDLSPSRVVIPLPVPTAFSPFSSRNLSLCLSFSPVRNNKRSTRGETTPRPSVIAPIFAQEVRRQFGRTAHHRPGKVRLDNERPCGR